MTFEVPRRMLALDILGNARSMCYKLSEDTVLLGRFRKNKTADVPTAPIVHVHIGESHLRMLIDSRIAEFEHSEDVPAARSVNSDCDFITICCLLECFLFSEHRITRDRQIPEQAYPRWNFVHMVPHKDWRQRWMPSMMKE